MTVVQRRKELKSKAICISICCLVQLTWIVPLGIKWNMYNADKDTESVLDNESASDLETEIYESPIVEVVSKDTVTSHSEADTEFVETEIETEEFINLSFIPVEIQKLCFEIGNEYHISPELLIAIIERESGGNVNAKNKSSGCMGLMQLHPKYANYYLKLADATDPFNAEDNIRAGCEILSEKFEQYSDLPLVLMKYHGESNANIKYESGNYSKYCMSIMERMEEMQEITGG